MYDYQNQSNLQQGLGQFSFVPTSRSLSNLGSTVTYHLTPSNNVVNAMGGNYSTSGNINAQQNSWQMSGQPFGQFSNYNQILSSGFNPQFNNQVIAQGNNVASGYFPGNMGMGMVQPSVDISETSSDVVITADLPNVNPNDVRLNVTENSVSINASAWLGNSSLRLNRTIALPTSIRSEAIDANLQSGVLEIRCPKSDRSQRSRITIKNNQQG